METQKLHHFALKCWTTALPDTKKLLDVFNLADPQIIFLLLYDSDSRDLVINLVQLQAIR